MSAAKEFRARHAIGQAVRGEALVASDGFSARYDLGHDAPTTLDLLEKMV